MHPPSDIHNNDARDENDLINSFELCLDTDRYD